ncbi:MAG: hypothetical protein WBW14_26525 [Candidatus Acidiferrum sp.]
MKRKISAGLLGTDSDAVSFPRLVLLLGDAKKVNPGHQTLHCWYNQAALAIPALAPEQIFATTWGNSAIGNLRGPNLVNFDVVFQKNFKIHESQQIQFRAEFFNIFNHPNFGLPGANPDVPGGAAITSTSTDNRQIEFALKYTF